MPAQTITCPECQVTLRVAEPPPPGQGARIVCPRCGSQFSLQADAFHPAAWVSPAAAEPLPAGDDDPPVNPAWRTFLPALLLAVAGASFVVGASILAAMHFSGGRGAVAEQPAAPAAVERPAEEPQPADDADKRARAREKDRREFTRLMIQAGVAKDGKRYDDAVKAYGEALKLFPDDVDAAEGLRESQSALAAAAGTKANDEQRRAEFDRLMKQGRDAMAAKHYAAAVRAFEVAIQVLPSNADATQAVQDAKAALGKDESEKKKLTDYENHMAAGRAAVVAERYADALHEFVAAGLLLPGDAAAGKARRDAEKRLDDLRDENKRHDALARLLEQGGAALRNHRYQEAIRAYRAALKLFPRNQDAKDGLRAARKAQDGAKAEFARLVEQGDTAMVLQQYQAAVLAYRDANRLFPDDQGVSDALRLAEQAVANIGTGVAAYQQLMAQGLTALRARRYADAVTAFTGALRLVPGDPDAAQGLSDAQAGLDRRLKKRAEFDKQMRAGTLAYRRGSYADAVQAFEAAVQQDPDSAKANAALSQARYAQHMSAGQAAMTARRYADAAAEFQAALDVAPGDARAMAALRQARQFKR